MLGIQTQCTLTIIFRLLNRSVFATIGRTRACCVTRQVISTDDSVLKSNQKMKDKVVDIVDTLNQHPQVCL